MSLKVRNEYLQKQVWGERFFTRQSSKDLVRTKLTNKATMTPLCSPHDLTYLETICVHSYVAQIFVVYLDWL